MIRKIPLEKITFSTDETNVYGGSANVLLYTYSNKRYLIFDDTDDILSAPICKFCGSVTAPTNEGKCNHCGAFVNSEKQLCH